MDNNQKQATPKIEKQKKSHIDWYLVSIAWLFIVNSNWDANSYFFLPGIAVIIGVFLYVEKKEKFKALPIIIVGGIMTLLNLLYSINNYGPF